MPYPVDYGGVFDLFYKIKSLHEAGVHIRLHCFEYGRGRQSELNKYCETVTYYKRMKFNSSSFLRVPYIVGSRANPLLLKNILTDDFPVLLEGIHCTYFLYTNQLKNKNVLVRLHNAEFEYYKELGSATTNVFKKMYYKSESFLLKKYEAAIANKALLVAVSEKDKEIYQKKFQAKNIDYIPVFLPYKNVLSKDGKGNFCLYHGNLAVAENEKAALWLISKVFNSIDIPLIIAGKKPSKHLRNAIKGNTKFRLIANPSGDEMNELIKKAHIHVLPSFNRTGIKLKLINALFNGRFVITNYVSVEGTNLATLCSIAEDVNDFKKAIKQLFNYPFSKDDIAKRKSILESTYSNDNNAQKLIKLIW